MDDEARTAFDRLRRRADVRAHPAYFDAATGGFVVVHRGHQTTGLAGEMATARHFARRGVWVQLLDETGDGPFADARHGGPHGDGLTWDYKLARAGGNPKTQIQNALRSGKRPSGHVVVRFEEANVDLDLLNEGVRAQLFHDRRREQPLIRRIVVLHRTAGGYVEEARTAEAFNNGKIFQGPRRTN
jgi:hypothetical protein